MAMVQAADSASVDEATLAMWAERYEQGEFPGTAGETIVRSQFGRPRLFAEPMIARTVRLRVDQGAQLARFARADLTSPSALMREAWDEYAERRERTAK